MTSQPIPILLYHSISDEASDAFRTWTVGPTRFAEHMSYISESGFTVRSIARFRPRMPIIGFSPKERTVRQLTLSWGTVPVLASGHVDNVETMDEMIVAAREAGHIRTGDVVAVLAGTGGRSTDMLRLAQVP